MDTSVQDGNLYAVCMDSFQDVKGSRHNANISVSVDDQSNSVDIVASLVKVIWCIYMDNYTQVTQCALHLIHYSSGKTECYIQPPPPPPSV